MLFVRASAGSRGQHSRLRWLFAWKRVPLIGVVGVGGTARLDTAREDAARDEAQEQVVDHG
jgi:hypothetical protein